MEAFERDDSGEKRPARTKPKVPRKVSPRYLENSALYYLKRYSATVKGLKRVMMRKASRSLRHHGGDREQVVKWIDELAEKLVRNGLVNDESFARTRAHSLRSSGKSSRVIAVKLREKGLAANVVQHAVTEVVNEVSEVDAAFHLAKKKKLGPFRPAAMRKERRMKDLAAMARAGFSYAIAKRVIDSDGE